MGVYHGFEKNETATMFFLKKPSLVLKLSDLGHQIESLSTTQYAKVCQLKVNNKVMCYLSMKFSDMFDQTPHCNSDKIRDKHISMKNAPTV